MNIKIKILLYLLIFSSGIFLTGFASAATDVYYSVGQSNSTELMIGSPNVTITSGVATFTVAQTGNIGVGDRVIIGATTLYISGKIDTSNWNVVTNLGAIPADISAPTAVTHIYRTFASLSAAITGASGADYINNTDLVAADVVLNISCYYDTGADTTAVTVNGYTTDAARYIKIYTPNNTATESNNSQRHSGGWDDGKYRLSDINYNGFHVYPGHYVELIGLQFKLMDGDPVMRISGERVIVDSCIVDGTSLTGTNRGILFGNGISNVKNSVFFSSDGGGIGVITWWLESSPILYISNSTVYGFSNGLTRNNGTIYAKNNISYNNTTDYSGTFDPSSTNNLSKDGTAPAYNTYYTNKTLSFVNITSGSEDFHLALTDADAINKGANLSADPNLPFNTDIDGEIRPTGMWDIGADEAPPAPVYYSVGQNTTSHETGAGNVTVSGTTATFTVAQTATKMGVGDVVNYDTDNKLCYISGKTSTTVWTCTNATGGTPTPATDVVVNSISHAFDSLSAAEAGAPTLLGNSDLTAIDVQLNFPCYYDTGADTTAVTVNGYTTDSLRYIKIYTPNNTSTEVNSSQRHSGKWDDGKYNLSLSNAMGIFVNAVNYVRIDGLQVAVNAASGNMQDVLYFGNQGLNNEIFVSNNILKGHGNNSYYQAGIDLGDTDIIAKVWNNTIYNIPTFGNGSNRAISANSAFAYIYNNTIVGSYAGIRQAAGTVIAKNNLISMISHAAWGTFAAGTDYNATDNSTMNYTVTGGGNTHDRVSQTFSFVDAANYDSHLSQEDTAARGAGANLTADANLPITTDIDGQLRNATGDGWDIGADEGTVEFAPTVMQSGGDYSSLTAWEIGVQTDLVADSTRVFSHGGVTGAIADDVSVTGLTSGATATVVHASADQILLENIAGTFQSGEVVEVSAGNSVTLSDNGNPASAVAKIDGAWTVADTAPVLISGWESGVDNYIKIYTTPTARHLGKWDDSRYRLLVGQSSFPLYGYENYLIIDGLQVNRENSATEGMRFSSVDGTIHNVTISNNIIKTVFSEHVRSGLQVSYTPSNHDIHIFNNVIYGYGGAGMYIDGNANAVNVNIFNNTVYNNGTTGIHSSRSGHLLVNNIANNNGEDFRVNTGPYSASSSNNISSDGTAPGTDSKINTTVQFVNPAGNDFRLSETDTAARDAGVNLSVDPNLAFTTDIQGTARGAAWDIGADEVPVEFVSTICETTSSGGDCAEMDYSTVSGWNGVHIDYDLDLSSPMTRVFSGTRTGTLNRGSTLNVYQAGVDTGITVRVAATTSDQILVGRIVGATTPLVVASGTEFRLSGGTANMWTVAGIGDDLGASPVLVGKIDGTWVNPDASTNINLGSYIRTSKDNYLKLYTTSLARHDGKWNDNKHRLVGSIASGENYYHVEGLQVNMPTDGNAFRHVEDDTISGEGRFLNNIIKRDLAATGGYGAVNIRSSGTHYVYNNIVYNFEGARCYDSTHNTDKTVYLYNNTFYNCANILNNAGTLVAKNNIAANTSSAYSGTFSSESTNNATDINATPSGSTGTNFVNQTFNFVSTTPDEEDFHLLDTDTGAKDKGADLSADLNLPVTTDIDGGSRDASVNAFDIGADETVTKIYRSVGPGATAVLTNDGSHARNVTMTAGEATFSAALADNVGVGDAILIDTGGTDQTIDAADTILFIHGRTDSMHYTLRTHTGAVPSDIAVNDTYQIYRAYTSLANAESGTKNTSIPMTFNGGNRDLVANNEQWNIACYTNGMTLDTVNVDVNGWNTAQQNFIKIFTPVNVNEVGVSQRHNGKWGSGYMRKDVRIRINDAFVRLDGLSAYEDDYHPFSVMSVEKEGEIFITNNFGITDSDISAVFYLANNGINFYVANNIAIGKGNISTPAMTIGGDTNSIHYVYNNTVIITNGGRGINFSVGTFYVKNNLVSSDGGGVGFYENNINTFYSSNNASSDATADDLGGTDNKINQTFSFVDATNNDFHLAQTDTAARGAGANLTADAGWSFSTDIDGQLRNPVGDGWDIGADEGTVEFAPTVMQSGGDYSNLAAWEIGVQTDLVADSTRVFSHGGVTGAIADDASVTGLTSGASATVVHASADQILLENISGTFQSGEVVEVSAGNNVTLSDNGNPASAVAKIDGTWTVADTTAVTVYGWNTGVDNYIKIYTTEAARHQGKWDDGKYYLEISSTGIYVREFYTHIDGIQMVLFGSSNYINGIAYSQNDALMNSATHTVSNCILKSINTSTTGVGGIGANHWDEDFKFYAYNNIIYGFGNAGIFAQSSDVYKGVLSNNTVYDIGENGIVADSDFYLHNNISQNNGVADYYAQGGGGFNASSSNNISSDATAPGTNSKTNTTVDFVSTEAGNEDFHLAETDVAAKDSGVDLSRNVEFAFSTDIDGNQRLSGVWDIGADEAPTKIYRSVGPSATDVLADDGAHARTVTVLNGVGSFTEALPDNIGVGDVVLIDTGGTDQAIDAADTLLFIHKRNSSKSYDLRTQTGAMPADVAANDTYQVYRAHTSLANAEAGVASSTLSSFGFAFNGGDRDLVTNNEQWNIAAYANGDVADTASVSISSWNTDALKFVKIYTPVNSGEVGVSQRHEGVWNDNAYALKYTTPGANQRAIVSAINYLRVDGLQIKYTSFSNGGAAALLGNGNSATDNEMRISNNIVWGDLTDGSNALGMELASRDSDARSYVYNNIIYGFSNNSCMGYRGSAFNNTVFNCGIGISTFGYEAINNIAQNSTTCFSGTNASSSNNISSDATAPGTNSKINTTVNFIDIANQDFHLAPSDTAAKDAGVDLSTDENLPFWLDIDGEARAYGPAWDIGADEAVNVDTFIKGGVEIKGGVRVKN